MRYWWVNHKQTFTREFEGGYIWSPKNNRDNTFNQTYLNLKETSVGDVIFSYADTFIKAVGVIEENCVDSQIPPEFGQTGTQWNTDGYLVKINWARIQKPIRPKEHIGSIAPFLPEKFSPIQANGNGNQKFYLTGISSELGEHLVLLLSINNPLIVDILLDLRAGVDDYVQEKLIKNSVIPDTEKIQLIRARVGQGLFRQNVLSIESRCRITQLKDSRLLIASHIKPWRSSSNEERLDGSNGLLLSPHIDRLFDRGWITFSNSGNIIVGNESAQQVMRRWNINKIANVGSFSSEQSLYLDYHRDLVFNSNH